MKTEHRLAATISRLLRPTVEAADPSAIELRALLRLEWRRGVNDGEASPHRHCPYCITIHPEDRGPSRFRQIAHMRYCRIDRALRAFGYGRQLTRDAARRRMAKLGL